MKKTLARGIVFAFLLASFAAAKSQTAHILRDVNQTSRLSPHVSSLCELGGSAFFVLADTAGFWLMRSDGAEIEAVEPLFSFCDWSVSHQAEVGFAVSDGAAMWFLIQNVGLFRFDGATNDLLGPVDLGPIYPFLEEPFAGGRLVFLNNQGELAATDGTLAGTEKLADGVATSLQTFGFRAGNRLIFEQNLPNPTERFWTTDGTAAGTVPLRSDDGLFSPTYFFRQKKAGEKRFLTFGETSGQMRLYALKPDSSRLVFLAETPEQGLFLFGADSLERMVFATNENSKARFWTTDGTQVGTKFWFENPTSFNLNHETNLFFEQKPIASAYNLSTNEPAVWAFDSLAGAAKISGWPSVSHFFEQNGLLFGLDLLNQKIYRLFGQGSSVATAWSPSLLTGGGSIAGEPITLGERQLFVIQKGAQSRLFSFENDAVLELGAAFDALSKKQIAVAGTRLLIRQKSRIVSTDCTAAGTFEIGGIVPQTAESNPLFFKSDGPRAYFLDDFSDASYSDRLWTTDGATTSEIPLGQFWYLASSPAWSEAGQAVGKTDKTGAFWFSAVIFDTNLFSHRQAICRAEPSGGAQKIKFFEQSSAPHYGFNVVEHDGQFCWFAPRGDQIWRTDGSENGTVLIDSAAIIRGLFSFQNRFYFQKSEANGNRQLWRSDGATTEFFANFDFDWSARTADAMYFLESETATIRVWRSDGSALPEMIFEFSPSLPQASINHGQLHGSSSDGRAFLQFQTWDGVTEIWRLFRLDGAVPEKLFESLDRIETVQNGPVIDGKTYFLTKKGLHRTDGTASGTTLAVPLNIIENYDLESTGEALFWPAYWPQSPSTNLWKSDGTPSGTGPMFQDSCFGPFYAAYLTRFGDRFLFEAFEMAHSTEPWVLGDLTSPVAPEPTTFLSKEAWEIFPNPLENALFFEKKDGSVARVFEKVKLIDALGRVVLEASEHRSDRPLLLPESLPNGPYFLFWVEKSGKTEAFGPLLKLDGR